MTLQPRCKITKADVNLVSSTMLVNDAVTAAKLADDNVQLIHADPDEVSSLFYVAKEVDFGQATAVDTKITDSMPAKGKLIMAQGVVTEVFNGDNDTTIVISKAASGATAMGSSMVVDKDAAAAANYLGASMGVIPNADGSEIQTATGDVYAYAAANSNRSTGKMHITLVFMKTA